MISNKVASTNTQNIVPVQAAFNTNGQCLGLIGPGGAYFSPPLNNDTITGVTINNSTIGSTTPATGNFTNLYVNNDLIISETMPTIGSGFGTGNTILGANTAGFQITVGTGGAAGGTITFPAATNGWVVQAWDITGSNSLFIQQTGSTKTSATITSFGITTGLPANMSAGDKILVMAMAF